MKKRVILISTNYLKKVKNNVDMGSGFWYYIQALGKRVTQEKVLKKSVDRKVAGW